MHFILSIRIALRVWTTSRKSRAARSRSLLGALCLGACVGIAPVHAATLAGGLWHSAQIHDDGTLWMWGHNRSGQLGDGTLANRATPVMVLSGTQSVAPGSLFTLALKIDGTVWAWGDNESGQLGDGTTARKTVPVQVLTGVRAIAAGDSHALAVKTDGSLWAWGRNDKNQLGDGTTVNRLTPVRLAGIDNVQEITAGNEHSLVVKADGTLWAWGGNDYGQLGDGTKVRRATPTQVFNGIRTISAGTWMTLALGIDGTAYAWGNSCCGRQIADSFDSAVPVSMFGGVQAIAAGGGHSLVLKTDGTLWSWGSNTFGEVGTVQGTQAPQQVLSDVRTIGAGALHSLAVKNDGTLWAWGLNESGQLGDATTASRVAPLVVFTDARAIAAGAYHSLAVKNDGTLWSWGYNYFGELGDGTTTSRSTPMQILGGVSEVASGPFFSLALKTDGSVWAWGENFSGQIGDGTTGFRLAPVKVLEGARSIAAGTEHSLALKNDGTVWAWGSNAFGQLGDGTQIGRLTPVQVATAARAIAAGAYHSLVVKSDVEYTLFASGSNRDGQLGDGTTIDRATPVQIRKGIGAIAAGGATSGSSRYGGGFSLASQTNNTLVAWGANSVGQLGDATTVSRPTAAFVLNDPRQIAAGFEQSLATTADGSLWVWGAVSVPGVSAELLRLPQQHPFVRDVVRVAAGTAHVMALTATGRVLAWGDNSGQQLAVEHLFKKTVPSPARHPLAAYAGADLVVEFFNPSIRNGAGTPGIGHFFITASAAEVASIEQGGSGPGWTRTGRTFRAWNDQLKAPANAVPVCRFYARVPNSHFYTASASECQFLKDINPTNDPALGWSYEGIAFYSVLPLGKESPTTWSDSFCPAGYFPIYRSYNNRFSPDPQFNDGNHRITPSFNDYQRSIRFLGFADEGIRFCSPASSAPSADLQATYSFPGAAAQGGETLSAEFIYNNNGPGAGDGGSILLALPAEVGNWNVSCEAHFGATCPATNDLRALREGSAIPTWPAGGTLVFTATGTAPLVGPAGDATLTFAATVAGASGTPDSTPANDTPPRAHTAIKATACNAVLNPTALAVGAAAQSPHVALFAQNCTWTAQSSATWLTVSPAGGSGDATLTLTLAANTSTAPRTASVTVNGKSVLVSQSGVACSFSAAPATLAFTPAGQSATVAITAPAGCAWTAQSTDSWLAVSPASGNGSASLSVIVQANAGSAARSGTITVGNVAIPVAQSGTTEIASLPALPADPCATLRLQRDGDQVAPGGFTGAQSFDVFAEARCYWSVKSNTAWITLTAEGSGSGQGTVSYLVDPNDEQQARSGTIAVSAKSFTVNQLGNAASQGGGDSGGDGGGTSGSGSSGGSAG